MFVFVWAYVRVAGSFAGLGFLSWYLAGKMTAFDRRGHVAKLCVVLLPLLVAALVAVSRVDDYWHHWQDVCTGGVLGTYVGALLLITARKRVVLLVWWGVLANMSFCHVRSRIGGRFSLLPPVLPSPVR
jgi:membrane-associated phospholipid phosphatase